MFFVFFLFSLFLIRVWVNKLLLASSGVFLWVRKVTQSELLNVIAPGAAAADLQMGLRDLILL